MTEKSAASVTIFYIVMYNIDRSGTCLLNYDLYTVEPPNRGHFGDNINSAVVSFVERLSSRRRFKMY